MINWLIALLLGMAISAIALLDMGDLFFFTGGLTLMWGVSLMLDEL